MIEDKIHSVLSAGVSMVEGRVYPLIMPQDTQKDCVVYQVIGTFDRDCVIGDVWSQNVMIQIDVFAKTFKNSLQIRDEVRDAMRAAFKISGFNVVPLYENITVKYRQMCSMTISAYKEYAPVHNLAVDSTMFTVDNATITVDKTVI